MTEYTPDTPTVKAAYTRAMRDTFVASASEHDAEFDRWLAKRNRSIRQSAWDEAVKYGIEHFIIGGTDGDDLAAANPYRQNALPPKADERPTDG